MKPGGKNDWPFDQPRNCATFTTRQVLEGLEPILSAYHDADDHGWQFFGATDASVEGAKIVSLEEMVELDRTIFEIADLLPGWQATREKTGGCWSKRMRAA